MSYTSAFTAIMRTSLTGGILALMLSACATPLASTTAATSETADIAPTVISYKKWGANFPHLYRLQRR